MTPHLLFIVLFLVPSSVIAAYYLIWAVAGVAGVRDVRHASTSPRHRFLIVIPAHNEQASLLHALASCEQLDYPPEMFVTTVLADNCQDATAEIARGAGVTCLERNDPDRLGKGYALAWALERLQQDRAHDAYVILDADCTLDPQALRVADAFLTSGARVLQTNHRIMNPDATPISYAAAVGRRLEYDLFFAPKSCFGFAVLLVGTGMVLHRSVLEQCPWTSHSCTEDTEYTIRLAEQHQPVRFASNAWIECRAAETISQLRIQRNRWAQGNLSLGRSLSLRLMGSGILQGPWLLADLGWTLLLLSRPLILAHLAATVVFSLLLLWLAPGAVSQSLFFVTLGLLAAYGVYLLLGILTLGLTARRAKHLLGAPWVLIELVAISLRAVFRPEFGPWRKTPRS